MADIAITTYTNKIYKNGASTVVPGFIEGNPGSPVNPPGSGGTSEFVPYIGALQNVNLGEKGLSTGYVTFDTTPTGTPTTQGTMSWNDARETLDLRMNGTIQPIGQAQYFYAKNSTGTSIAKGRNVRFAGTDGGSGHILIAEFLADGTYPSSYYMGVTAEAIGNGEFGQVMAFGELSGINTSGYSAGALLYASTTSAGAFQTTAPVATNNIVLVAAAINSKNNGDIIVRPQIGSNIKNDEGVLITSPTNGQVLSYDSVGGLWKNANANDTNKVSYNQADSKNATERNQARVNIGSTSSTPQIIATAGAIDDLTITSNSLVFTGASVVLSGIVAGLDGEEIAILNASGTNLELLSQSLLSSANNRFASGVIVPNLSIVRIKYRTTTSRWVLENVGINDGRYVRKDIDDTKNGNLTLKGNLIMNTAGSFRIMAVSPENLGNDGHTFGEIGLIGFSVGRHIAGPNLGRATPIFHRPAVSVGAFYWQSSFGLTTAYVDAVTGRIGQSRSNLSSESVRRDELYLNYSETVTTSGTINDLAINSDCKLLILTVATDLTGVVPVDNTRLLRIEARGVSPIIRDQSVSSVAANRFALGTDLTINDGEVYQFIYTNTRWRRVL